MKLTTFTDYSLRVLIYLAARPGERGTISRIAAAFDISDHHLVKVVHFLGKHGWLKNVRGKGGGLELGRVPAEIVIGEPVRSTEGEGQLAECISDHGDGCVIASRCRLRGALEQAVAAFYRVLDGYTLADLVANREELATVLFLPRRTALPGHAAGRKA